MEILVQRKKLLALDLDDSLLKMFDKDGIMLPRLLEDFFKKRLGKDDYSKVKEIIEEEKEPIVFDFRRYYNHRLGKREIIKREDLLEWFQENNYLLLEFQPYEGIREALERIVDKHRIVIITNRVGWWGEKEIVEEYTRKWIKKNLGIEKKIKLILTEGKKPERLKELCMNAQLIIVDDSQYSICDYIESERKREIEIARLYIVQHNWNTKTKYDSNLPEDLKKEKEEFLRAVYMGTTNGKISYTTPDRLEEVLTSL